MPPSAPLPSSLAPLPPHPEPICWYLSSLICSLNGSRNSAVCDLDACRLKIRVKEIAARRSTRWRQSLCSPPLKTDSDYLSALDQHWHNWIMYDDSGIIPNPDATVFITSTKTLALLHRWVSSFTEWRPLKLAHGIKTTLIVRDQRDAGPVTNDIPTSQSASVLTYCACVCKHGRALNKHCITPLLSIPWILLATTHIQNSKMVQSINRQHDLRLNQTCESWCTPGLYSKVTLKEFRLLKKPP